MEFQRLYTPEEAERSLPFVRRIVEDILADADRLRRLPEGDSRSDSLLEKIEGYFGELEELGCFYKDWSFSVGLVDFPAVIDGETVFLCWRSDESGIAYYHRIEEGFRGRRRLVRS